MTDPIDEVHAWSLDAIYAIRAVVLVLRERVAAWEPRPCPPLPERNTER